MTTSEATVAVIDPTVARRLAISRQRLAGPRPEATTHAILDVVRDLGCLQLDPTNAVARSHLLVLWSRLGAYDAAHLDALLWQERRLFEYWAHAASIVLTDDYPIHHLLMRGYAADDTARDRRVPEWMERNAALRDAILATLAERGSLPARAFPDTAAVPWESSGWTGNRNVERMLTFLWMQGRVAVAGRERGQKLWDVATRFLPPDTPREILPEREVVKRAAQRSLRALGVARPAHIVEHFTRYRYPGLDDVLAELETEGRVARVEIADDGRRWPGPWYVHADDLALLDPLRVGVEEPRTTLLSPFDNLICDRRRTEMLFDFSFRLEIYVPRAKRQYGYYVMPILHGDRLIGRLDPALDRKAKRLAINAIYLEPDVAATPDIVRAVMESVEDLARFVGATEIAYGDQLPAGWRSSP